MKDDDARQPDSKSGVSRRDFMKISAVTAAVPLVMGTNVVEAAGEEVPIHGPGKVPVTLNVNGKKLSAELEPRVTLLDALARAIRHHRRQTRLRSWRLWGMYRAARRQAGVRLLSAGD